MDLSFTPDEIAFREEVRAFLKEHVPQGRPGTRGRSGMTKEATQAWHELLYKKGWVAPHLPKEYGGTGWTPIQQHIFAEECGLAGAPRVLPFGLKMLAPVLLRFGSEEQKRHYLPKMMSGEHIWCQGYSEPGAGSDLASLKTSAVLEGDEWVINGQKTWTTLGHWANWIFVLCRTSKGAKKQDGISLILAPMDTPGITLRPIITIDGEHEVNEVFFDNVRVPKANIVGEEGKAWTYAKVLLEFERTNIAEIGSQKRLLSKLKMIAREESQDGTKLIEDEAFAAELARIEIEIMALEMSVMRVLDSMRGGRTPGPESSFLKIKGTELQQAITELTTVAIGPYATPWQREALAPGFNGPIIGPDYALGATPVYFNMRKTTIYGGSNEIQKNIIAKAVLGL